MKILVLSDSHSALRYMKAAAGAVKPQAMVHLGDHYGDGEVLKELFPQIPLYRVPGNCDSRWDTGNAPEVRCCQVLGLKLYMTHGHRHWVKQTTALLLKDAREAGADAVLYGHTHIPDCHREPDGLWVLNPGSCGYGSASVGLIETENGTVQSVRILKESDWEEYV